MRISRVIPVTLFALFFAVPARAGSDPEFEPSAAPENRVEQIENLLSPKSLLRGKISEEDIDEIFMIMRSGMLGKTVEPSARLKQKMEAIGSSVKIRGALAGMLLLDEIERSAKKIVREINQDPNAI